MVRAALHIRNRYRRLTTLTAERGEPWQPIDFDGFLAECSTSVRQSTALVADCHHRARIAQLSRRGS